MANIGTSLTQIFISNTKENIVFNRVKEMKLEDFDNGCDPSKLYSISVHGG